MKIGIHAGAWGNDWSNDKLNAVDICKCCGLDFIEIPLTNHCNFDPIAIRNRCGGDLEVTCSAVLPGEAYDIGANQATCRNRGIDFLKTCIDLTHTVGAQVFSGMCYALPRKTTHTNGLPDSMEIEHCAASIKQVAKHAQHCGIKLGIEPAGRYHIHLLNTAQQAVRFLEMVNEPNVFIHLDSYHMCYEERSFPQAIYAADTHLKYFHMNGNDRGLPGEDDSIDWDAVFCSLKKIQFDGYIGFESFTTETRNIFRDVIGDPKDYIRTGRLFVLHMLQKYGFNYAKNL